MAIGAPSVLTGGTELAGSATSLTTASVTPTAGRVVVLVGLVISSIPTDPVVTGVGLTWTLQRRQEYFSPRTIFVATGVGTPSTGVITATAGGIDTWTDKVWAVFEFPGVDTTTPLVAANTVSNKDGAGVNPYVLTYNQAFAAGGAGLSLWGFGGGSGTATPRASWTEIYDTSGNSQFTEGQYILGPDTAGSADPGPGYGNFGIILELSPAASGASFQYFYPGASGSRRYGEQI